VSVRRRVDRQQAIAVLEQESPDAVIVDPLSTSSSASSIAAGFDKIYPVLRGRVLSSAVRRASRSQRLARAILGFPAYLATAYCKNFGAAWESFFRPKEVLRRIIISTISSLTASFKPIRGRPRRPQLLPGSWSINPEASRRISGSNRKPIPVNLALVGQIADSNRLDRQFDSIPVVLHWPQGPHRVCNDQQVRRISL